VVPAAVAVVANPLMTLLADRLELASHPAKLEAVGAVVTDVTAVPPLATGSAVPEYDRAKVPVVVTGEPETDRKAGADSPTLVTPVAAAEAQLVLLPSVVSILLALVACEGKRAFKAALAVVCPVPPFSTGKAVPE
jgi:hypothetical protein